MAQQLTIHGRAFRVETRGADSDGRPRYHLHGARGALYATMRNVHRPHMMFLFKAKGAMPFKGVWLSDESGDLRVVQS